MLPNSKNIVFGSQFIGLEIFSIKGDDFASLLNVSKKKEGLVITDFKESITLSELNEKHIANIPCYLVINNAHVLQKEINSTDSNDTKLVYAAFPNLKIEDFYYEIWRTENKSIIAICRKNHIVEIIKKLKEKGITIAGISIGNSSLSEIIPFLTTDSIQTNSYDVNLSDSDLILKPIEVKKSIIYDINGLEIKNSLLLGFACVLREVVKENATSGNYTSLNSELTEDFFQTNFFKKGVRFSIFFLLILLLINFFIFNYYYKKSENLSENLIANENILLKINSLQKGIKLKEEKINANNTPSKTKCSYIINEIIKTIPNSILLDGLTYHPLEEKIKYDSEIIIQTNQIDISGKTLNPKEFTSWIDNLNKIKWINKTTITKFGKDENNVSLFAIKIIVDKYEVK